jgi:single-strand DNA-binding protein
MSSSAITIVGNLTREPELKFLNSGHAVCRFSVAVNRKVKDVEQSSFFECDAFGTVAENVANSLTKGNRVIVFGELVQRSWKTEAGENRSVTEIKVEAVGPDLRFAVASPTSGDVTRRPRQPDPLHEGEDYF